MLWWWCLTREFFMLSTWVSTSITWQLVVDDTVDDKDNLEEKTREDADIRRYHIGRSFFKRMWYSELIVDDINILYIFNQCDNLEGHVCWLSGTMWMTRTFRWRRPWRLVTSWCIHSLRSFLMRAGLTKPRFMTSLSCIRMKKTPSLRRKRRRRMLARRRRRPMILTEVIMMSRNSIVSSSWMSLPFTRSLTTKPRDFNVFRNVESIKKL